MICEVFVLAPTDLVEGAHGISGIEVPQGSPAA